MLDAHLSGPIQPSARTARRLTGVMNRGRRLRGSAGIAVAIAVMNVATYGYTIVAARLLGPRELRRLRRGDGAAARRRRAPARTPGHRRATDRGAPRGRRGDRAQPAPGHLGSVARPGPAVPGADSRDQRGAAPRQPGHRVPGGAGRAAADRDGRSGRHPPGRTSMDRRWPWSTSRPASRGWWSGPPCCCGARPSSGP